MPNSAQSNAYNGAQSTGIGVLKDALGNTAVVGMQVPAGAAAGNVLTSDASGNITNAPNTAVSSVLTTPGDLLIENATPAPARLAVGSAGQVLGVSGGLPAWGMGMTLLATTGPSGVALVNGTPTIMTWTAPNDGLMHRVFVIGELIVATNETGGAVTLNYTDPAANGRTVAVTAANLTSGQTAITWIGRTVQANTAVTVTQAALTGGAATLYAELWGS